MVEGRSLDPLSKLTIVIKLKLFRVLVLLTTLLLVGHRHTFLFYFIILINNIF